MENSQLEDMTIGQMISNAAAAAATEANKHDSILSLTLDEIQCKSGKNFGGMSMDEFLANIWNVEDIQNQLHSQSQENQPQNQPFVVPNNLRSNLCSQGSFSIPIPLCGKTVDEIWSEIHKEKQHSHPQKFINVQQNPCQSQQALGEMTLEDFLVKAGVVQEASSSCSMKQQLCSVNNRSMVDLGFGIGEKLGLSLSYQQNNEAARVRNMSGNCFSTYQMLTQSVGEPSDNSSIQKCQSLMTDWVEPSNKKRIIDGPAEVVVQRRQRRMIKNRESAARSRARKQAYTVELEVELNQLKEENIKLKQIVAESERNRKQEIMQRKQSEKRQKPTEKLRAMRRIASMACHGPGEEEKIMTRKQKAESKTHENEQSPKKVKSEDENGRPNGKSEADLADEFEELCKATRESVSIDQMKEILQMNDQDSTGPDYEIASKCQDLLFYGALETCPVCSRKLVFDGKRYSCNGFLSEWSTCTFKTKDPPRKNETIKLPESVLNSPVSDLIKKYQNPGQRPKRNLGQSDKPFSGMTISLSGRLSRTHHYWRKEIEKHGGTVNNSVIGVSCLVVSPAERERGGSSKVAEAVERGIRVIREAWLLDCIEKQEVQPLEAYDVVTDLAVEGKGIPWDKQDPSEEALQSLTAELKLYGKRGVHKDTKLQEQGGEIFEKDGILYNCAFSLCDQGRGLNEYCITQLIKVPDKNLHLFYKKGKVGDDPNAEERLEEWDSEGNAVKEFERLFEEITGNEFEPWEREKKFEKKRLSFHPIDMDDGVDVRHGGLGPRQLGIAAVHSKLDPAVANFMKVLCSQEIYKYALMEMGHDPPEFPMGMLSKFHLERCDEVLLEFIEKVKSMQETGFKAEAVWTDYSNRWFTLMHSTRPLIFKDYQEIAEHAVAVLEAVRDVTVASHLIGDMSGSTIDDPLSDRYEKLGGSVSLLEKDSDDYKMIVNYLEKTYEPVKVGDIEYGVSVDNIFSVESAALPSYEEMKKLPNKVLLWCGTRSSNLLRHLHKGFLPAICSLPVPGYMFGRAIVCSDAAAEAARYGFTAVDRPEGFLVLAIVSLGEEITEITSSPEDTKSLEEKKMGVKALGRKKTDESEHFVWKDEIRVPCGSLTASEHKNSPLEYNEYAVYDPKQTSIRFLVGVKYEEKGVVMDTQE